MMGDGKRDRLSFQGKLITKTGCDVWVRIVSPDVGGPFVSDNIEGVYLNLAVDTRVAELKMEPEEAEEIARLLIVKADALRRRRERRLEDTDERSV